MAPDCTAGHPEAPVVRSFVALGDSFTEGMSDRLPDGSYRGWADLLAARLAARAEETPAPSAAGTRQDAEEGFRYANLAVRGKLIGQIAAEQVDTAAAMNADLVTLVGGLNDTLRPRCDMARVCGVLEECVAKLAPSCGRLVLMHSPGRNGPGLERCRGRMEQLFAFIDELAERYDATVVNLYTGASLADQRLWDVDRLHLTAEGHRRVAEAVCQQLGHPALSDWRAPLPASPAPAWLARRRADVRFTREHLLPWIGRRLTGRSSGDGRAPKRPELTALACEDTQ
ncbi:GDSL family lipase [Streptomyces abyssalis]|uniref:GDSL family lipase n=2 Tax=Streptomyces abyssalis TaxID=933944 RepID=A0A1E7JVL4_9ACTN|nr:SGNH/GDSL hydrolase family protein [Streptomyces abyssalis]OEU94479.1 GDSL family lipase [Streptomyces abyssalis]OEU95862.1 GDSL family lipase [Streptomyces abyssalis]